jgi:hypothetical protein
VKKIPLYPEEPPIPHPKKKNINLKDPILKNKGLPPKTEEVDQK